jgi:zinc metalloprotease ZmpB
MTTQKLTTTNDARFSYDERTGAVRSFFGAELVGPSGQKDFFDRNIKRSFDAVDESRDFLETNKEVFKLENISLEARDVGEGQAIKSVTFQQSHHGVPVYEAKLVIGLRALDGHIISGVNKIDYQIPSDVRPEEVLLTREDAADIVSRMLKPKVPKLVLDRDGSRLFLYRHSNNPPDSKQPIAEKFLEKVGLRATASEGKLYWVWQVMVDTREPDGNWEVLLDAIRAEIVAVFDRRRYAMPKAYIFKPDPITSSANGGLSWNTNVKELNNERAEVTLEDLDAPDSAGNFSLSGKWVKCVEKEPVTFPPPQSTGDFMFGAKDRDFLFTMTYYWTNELIKYLRGFNIKDFNDKTLTPFEIDAVGLADSGNPENSHFVVDSVGKPYIAFGEGGVPDASDAHVIVHEYGHALHYFLNRRQYCYEEGFCDFLATVWLDRFNHKQFRREEVFPWDNNQLMPWDTNRVLNLSEKFDDQNFNSYPRYLVGDILATALWTLYLDIGGNDANTEIRKKAADTVIHLYLTMLLQVTPYADKEVLGMGLLGADQALHGLQGKYRQQIWNAFKKRGLWYDNPPPVTP